MTRDDIIRMAEDCGISEFENNESQADNILRFAALIAAAERERLKWDGIHSCHAQCDRPACVNVRKAVEAEREACAKVVENYTGAWDDEGYALAQAIRARGQV